MTQLFFPYDIEVLELSGIKAPDYPVDIATSKSKLETRTLISDDPSEASISIVIDNETDESMASLWDFYQLCNGKHRSFVIREDHNLYALMPEFARRRFLPLWRFSEALSYDLVNSKICLYGISITLFNVQS